MERIHIKDKLKLIDNLCAELTKVMNEIHNTSFSDRFWRLLISSHVGFSLSRKHLLDKKVINKNPLFEAINGASFPTLKHKALRLLRYYYYYYKNTRKAYTEIDKVLSANDHVAFGFHDTTDVVGRECGKVPDYFPLVMPFTKSKYRRKLKQIADRYDDVLMKNIILQLPIMSIENFQKLYDSIPLVAPGKKTMHVSLVKSEFMKMLLAKYSEHGAELHFYQPGGFFGELKYHGGYHQISKVADKFFTWGWKINACDVPSYAHRLSKFQKRYNLVEGGKLYDAVLCYPVPDPMEKARIATDTLTFLRNQQTQDKTKILARPRPKFRTIDNSAQLAFIPNGEVIKDEGKGPLADLIARSKLVIHMAHPSTNFLECLFVDHPCMAILSNPEPTDIVKPFYEHFLKIGVFHKNGESLAHWVNKINIDQWWAGVLQDPLFQEYKRTFLRKQIPVNG
jgi:hypothetical protein